MPVVRYLEWFDTTTERLVGRVELAQALGELQELFGAPRGDPMYDCWEVKPEHIERLQVWTGRSLELREYAYFVSAEME
jgi:hypothetical protein